MKPRAAAGLAAVIALLWAALLWTQRRAASVPAPAPEPVALAAPGRAQPPARAPKPLPAASPTLPTLRPADLIAGVDLDKHAVCPGEDFVASIRGKPENARSALPIAELDFNINGNFGEQIALSALEPGPAEYTVVASNGVDKIEYRKFSVDVLEPDSRACAERTWASVAIQRLKEDPNQIEARVTATHGLEHPQRYAWDFGDGTKLETQAPRAIHSYALREEARGMASYIVAVSVADPGGREAQGRGSVHFVNTHFRARAFGERLIAAVYDHWPRPGHDAYTFEVTFRSFEPAPVVFARAALKERSCGKGRGDRVQHVDPSELGVPMQLEAKATRQATLVIPSALIADDSCVLELELTGDTIPARTGDRLDDSPIRYGPVKSRLSFELRAAAPSERGGADTLASRRVQDPALLQKLRRAADLLGQARVTPEQLAELERQGKLAPAKPAE